MKAKTIYIPTFNELYEQAPKEIQLVVDKLSDTQQSKNWHPEGNCLIHEKIVYNRARRTNDINMTIASFFHDLGKVETTRFINGKWSAHGHENVSARLTERYKAWIQSLGADYDIVYYIVAKHMKVKHIHEMRPSKREAFQKEKYFDLVNKFSDFDNMQIDYKNDIDG